MTSSNSVHSASNLDMNQADQKSSFALAVVGCGLRAENYLKQMGVGSADCRIRLAALADPKSESIDHYRSSYSDDSGSVRTFDTGPQMFDAMGDELDAVIIASPNAYHRESLIPALERKLAILLEKPIATTVDDCAAMWRGYEEHPDSPLMVGFVLRFSPFYRRIKKMIDEGVVGQILSVNATEEMDASLTSVFARDWRRNRSMAGPLMLEKCSHDMDLLNWLIGSRPRRVASFARQTYFVPRTDAAQRCAQCNLAETCRYSPQNLDPYVIDPKQVAFTSDPVYSPSNDLCVFNVEKDMPDHQVVNLDYDNGVLATFAVTMDQPITTRTIRILGTKGQILGDVRRNQLKVIHHAESKNASVHEESIEIIRDDSGHDGADSGISNNFLAMMQGSAINDWPTLKEGIDASVIALVADRCSQTGQACEMKSVYQEIYGHVS